MFLFFQCNLVHILNEETWSGRLQSFSSTIWSALLYIFEHSYVSSVGSLTLLMASYSFVPSKLTRKKRVVIGALHVLAHLTAALLLMLLMELGIEVCIRNHLLATSGMPSHILLPTTTLRLKFLLYVNIKLYALVVISLLNIKGTLCSHLNLGYIHFMVSNWIKLSKFNIISFRASICTSNCQWCQGELKGFIWRNCGGHVLDNCHHLGTIGSKLCPHKSSSEAYVARLLLFLLTREVLLSSCSYTQGRRFFCYISVFYIGYHPLYDWYRSMESEHFPDPTGLRARLEQWTLGLYPACIKYLMSAFDVPEVIRLFPYTFYFLANGFVSHTSVHFYNFVYEAFRLPVTFLFIHFM